MNKEQLVIVTPSSKAKETQPDSISELISKCLYYWPYFVLSLAITVSAAIYYIKKAQPVYEIKAKLMIKDDKNVSADKTPLEKLNVNDQPKTVENEIEVLKSRELIEKVVNNLQLSTSYTELDKFSGGALYSQLPFSFRFISGNRDSLDNKKIDIIINDENAFTFKGLGSGDLNAKFNDSIKTEWFTCKLESSKYIKNYIGKTIRLSFENPEKTLAGYQSSINVTLVNKLSPVVELTIDDNLPERGKDVLNNLMKVYNETTLSDKNKVTLSTINFIDNRLASLTGELTSVEKSVEGFKSSRGMTDISSKAKLFLDNVQSNDSRLNDVNVQLDIVKGIEKYANLPKTSGNPPATLGIDDPGLIVLVNQLSALHLQKNRLLATTPEENPIFDPINRQIETTKEAIKDNLQTIKASLTSTKAQLQNNNSRFESSIRDIPGQERQYTNIKRQQEIKENLYVYLLQKREEIALSYASTINDAKIVDNAYYSVPKSPKKPLILALALVFGLVIPAGSIFGLGLIRGRISNKNEIEREVTAPVISEISHQVSKDRLISLDNKNKLILEQFRTLRTKLLNTHEASSGRVTLLTSSVAGEGKSFLVSNLGISLAASDRKTLILELDLRRPKVASLFDLPSGHLGITDYLRGKASEEQIIQGTEIHPNLYVIGCGSIPHNPSELLENGKVGSLIDWLKGEFDDILIDTPPVHLVTDALTVANLCQVTLYLIRQGFTSKKELHFIEELNRSRSLKNVNVIFNGINRKKHGYGYKYDSAYYK